MTCQTALKEGKERLLSAGIEEAALDAWYLLSAASGISRAEYFTEPQRELKEEAALQYLEGIAKRERHVPLQYILGTQEFMGLEFEVSEAVLIPRQDTEILVCEAMKAAKGASVLDVCTGSGCIIISLAKLAGAAKAAACDLSKEALLIAERNAKRLGVEVEFLQGDLFEPVAERYDVIVSNPPYIASAELEELMPEVRDYEPRLALDGSGDGLVFYRRIAAEAGKYLNPGGQLFLEIGCEQAEAVSGFLRENGYGDIRVVKDYAGLDRVVCARLA
ncbi:MAG: peptide chain release factor N(5)-glutamine methyltransferase [Lachnospiraceae bacterium]|nr:peptide chain release factor N(5)-glutamine methyltransferase [Lachnospiraceae bacterium]